MNAYAQRRPSCANGSAKTVLHEIGHFFGFDDEYLHSHGY